MLQTQDQETIVETETHEITIEIDAGDAEPAQ